MVYCAKKRFLGGTRMELTEEVKALLLNTAKELKGSARRVFMARTVRALGPGGQRLAERALGSKRGTMGKWMHEKERAMGCAGAFSPRGRQPRQTHLPTLLNDIPATVERHSH